MPDVTVKAFAELIHTPLYGQLRILNEQNEDDLPHQNLKVLFASRQIVVDQLIRPLQCEFGGSVVAIGCRQVDDLEVRREPQGRLVETQAGRILRGDRAVRQTPCPTDLARQRYVSRIHLGPHGRLWERGRDI